MASDTSGIRIAQISAVPTDLFRPSVNDVMTPYYIQQITD